MKILIMTAGYLPGFKHGGPVRTLSNLVNHLGDEYSFAIMTADRDLGQNAPYRGVRVDGWQKVGRARVYYGSRRGLWPGRVIAELRQESPDALYLNSFFDWTFSIQVVLLRRLGFLRDLTIILAPRGEFSPGALRLKPLKKRLYMVLAKWLRLYRGVIWQASTKQEGDDIRRSIGPLARVVVARNLRPPITLGAAGDGTSRVMKRPGELRLIFVSRIARKKNLRFALEILKEVEGQLRFDIYGPVKDAAYWEECQGAIRRLGANVRVQYYGPIPPEEVHAVLRTAHVFFMPSMGENFGHAIAEALEAGLPILISDQTPWRRLGERGVGWDIPLDRPRQFVRVLNELVCMDDTGFSEMAARVRGYAHRTLASEDDLDRHRALFSLAVHEGKGDGVERERWNSVGYPRPLRLGGRGFNQMKDQNRK